MCTCLCEFATVLIVPLLGCETVNGEASRHSALCKVEVERNRRTKREKVRDGHGEREPVLKMRFRWKYGKHSGSD